MIRVPLGGGAGAGGMRRGSQSVHGAGVANGVVVVSTKHVIIGAVVVAACALGGLWLFLRHEPAQSTLGAFQTTCIEGQRRGISGDTLPLDEETEVRLLAYCDCVAREVTTRLSPQDIAAIGLEQNSQTVNGKLDVIFNLCRVGNS